MDPSLDAENAAKQRAPRHTIEEASLGTVDWSTQVLHYADPEAVQFPTLPKKEIAIEVNKRGAGMITWAGVEKGRPPRAVKVLGVEPGKNPPGGKYRVIEEDWTDAPITVISETQRINEQLILRNTLAISRLRAVSASVTFSSHNQDDFLDMPEYQLQVVYIPPLDKKLYRATLQPDHYPPENSRLWSASTTNEYLVPQVQWGDGAAISERLLWYNRAQNNQQRANNALQRQPPQVNISRLTDMREGEVPGTYFYSTKDGKTCVIMEPRQLSELDSTTSKGTAQTQVIDIETGDILATIDGTYGYTFHSDNWGGSHDDEPGYTHGTTSLWYSFAAPTELGLEAAPLDVYTPSLTVETVLAASAEAMLKVPHHETRDTHEPYIFSPEKVEDILRAEKELIDTLQNDQPLPDSIYDDSIPHIWSIANRARETYHRVDLPRFFQSMRDQGGAADENVLPEDAPALLDEFDPLTTFDERYRFIVKAAESKSTQRKRIQWMQTKRSEIEATRPGEAPQGMTYELRGRSFSPVFSPDLEFQMGEEPYMKKCTHIPTGRKAEWSSRVDYETGRMIFLFEDNEIPVAQYAAHLHPEDMCRPFDSAASQYRVYRYKYDTANVAEDSQGNALAFWDEKKRCWIPGRPEGWRRTEHITNIETELYRELKSMAAFQGLLTGTPSEKLTSLQLSEQPLPPSDIRLVDPRYSLEGYYKKLKEDERIAEIARKEQREAERKAEEERETAARLDRERQRREQEAHVDVLLQRVDEKQAEIFRGHDIADRLIEIGEPRAHELRAQLDALNESTADFPFEKLPLNVQTVLREWHDFGGNVASGAIGAENIVAAVERLDDQLRQIDQAVVNDYVTTLAIRNNKIYARVEIGPDGQVMAYGPYGDAKAVTSVEIGTSGRMLNIARTTSGVVFRPSGNWGSEFTLPEGAYAIDRNGESVYRVTFDELGNVKELLGKPVGLLIDETEEQRHERLQREKTRLESHGRVQNGGVIAEALERAQAGGKSAPVDQLVDAREGETKAKKQPQTLADMMSLSDDELLQEADKLSRTSGKVRRRAFVQAAVVSRGLDAIQKANISSTDLPGLIAQLDQYQQEMGPDNEEAQIDIIRVRRNVERIQAVLEASQTADVLDFIGPHDRESLRRFQQILLTSLENLEETPTGEGLEELINGALEQITS